MILLKTPLVTWTPTAALRRGVVFALVLLVGATVAGRVDLAVLGTPFALGTALALHRRPRRPPVATVSEDAGYLVEGGDLAVDVRVENPDAAAYDFALVRPKLSPWLEFRHGEHSRAAPVPAARSATFVLRGRALRWGWHPCGPVEVRAVACDALLECAPVVADPLLVRVFPQTAPFKADDAMPRAAGLVGAHRSRRYGDGGELAGIRKFVPGDRLRRIDWRASLRARELHVAQTLSDRDAELVLLLDVLHEAGASGGLDGPPSVLDTTVRAAAGVAQHYLGRGDRVMLVEYGGRGRALRAGSGRRHFLAALGWLLAVQSGEGRYGPAQGMVGRYPVPSSALLVVLTPLLDARSLAMVARLARSGRSVVAVDTLPAHVGPARSGPWTEVASRLWRLDRQNTVDRLLEHGVPTVSWGGAGSLDHVLRDVSRVAASR